MNLLQDYNTHVNMTTYHILRCVPLKDRVDTATSLKSAFPETSSVVDTIVKEVNDFDPNQIKLHVKQCALKLFQNAIVSEKMRGDDISVVEVPVLSDVPSIYDNKSKYVSTTVHVTKTYTCDKLHKVTVGVRVLQSNCIVVHTSCFKSGIEVYRGIRFFDDTNINVFSYPPTAHQSTQTTNRAVIKHFRDGIVKYDDRLFGGLFEEVIRISFAKSDMDSFLCEYL